ncbi:MAG: hypothetical protein OEZ36_08790 [Spirochaetota bacterium]|nr:hypothetical protein [Spirochaetota bacterium]
MAWLSVSEYAKYKQITEAAVYKQIKQDKLITKKGEHNKTLIQTSLSDNHKLSGEHIELSESTGSLEKSHSEEMDRLEKFFNGLVEELKTAKNNEIITLKESYDKIMVMKDSQLDSQAKEIEKLNNEIDRLRKKGFFARLFGG